MDEQAFKNRTKALAVQVIHLVGNLPQGGTAAVLGKQLLRSATSVGANYRAACRAKSTADMIAKLAIVEEEADETLYWLELLAETNIFPPETLRPLWAETNELLSMTVTSIKTLRRKKIASPTPPTNPKSKIPNPKSP